MSAGSTSAGGSPRNGSSRSSGGHHGTPSARVDRRLVGRVRQRLERRDVRGRARRPQQRGPEPLGLGGDELDRHALDGHADRAPLGLLDHRDDLRQRGEARQHGRGSGAAQTTARCSQASRQRRTSPAASPPSASAIAVRPAPARGSAAGRAAARGSPSRASASSSCASRFGPDARARSAAALPPPPRAARRRCARRARARSRASGPR